MESIYGFTLEGLEKKLTKQGLKAYRARQIFSWVYKKGARDFSTMTDISQNQRLHLSKLFSFPSLKVLKEETSQDRTKKYLFELFDKGLIEAALIPDKKRKTLCVSTQVGCKFNCRFCASQEGGFIRNLKPAEIISQYLEVSRNHKITNLVYMGIGEPLDNFKNTVKSIKILTEASGANFTKRRISLSTCGLTDKIKELADLDLGIKISISLHAANDKKRSQLMPVNQKHPLQELIKALSYYQQKQKHPVTFEYMVIKNFNTYKSDLKSLVKLIKKTGAKLNLIPYNQTKARLKPPLSKEIEYFKEELKAKKITFTLRQPRGSDINAACGQLRSLSLKKNEKSYL